MILELEKYEILYTCDAGLKLLKNHKSDFTATSIQGASNRHIDEAIHELEVPSDCIVKDLGRDCYQIKYSDDIYY